MIMRISAFMETQDGVTVVSTENGIGEQSSIPVVAVGVHFTIKPMKRVWIYFTITVPFPMIDKSSLILEMTDLLTDLIL